MENDIKFWSVTLGQDLENWAHAKTQTKQNKIKRKEWYPSPLQNARVLEKDISSL